MSAQSEYSIKGSAATRKPAQASFQWLSFNERTKKRSQTMNAFSCSTFQHDAQPIKCFCLLFGSYIEDFYDLHPTRWKPFGCLSPYICRYSGDSESHHKFSNFKVFAIHSPPDQLPDWRHLHWLSLRVWRRVLLHFSGENKQFSAQNGIKPERKSCDICKLQCLAAY